jgi:PKD repeat protein
MASITTLNPLFGNASALFPGGLSSITVDSAANASFLSNGSSFTVSVWVILNSYTRTECLVESSTTSSTNTGIDIHAVSNTRIIDFNVYNSSNTVNFPIKLVSLSAFPNDGKKHHIVASYNSTTRFAALYFDGVLNASQTVSSSAIWADTPTTNLTLGNVAGNVAGSDYLGWNGQVDEFAAWNTAIPSTELDPYPTEIGTVLGLPLAAFSTNVSDGYIPLSVQFSDQSSVISPTGYSWNFGDKNISTVQNPTNTYVVAGTYIVSETVTNASGSNTAYRSVLVNQYMHPIARFLAWSNSTDVPVTVYFTDTSGGYPVVWLWNFGDGNTSTQENPMHTYTTGGNFSVVMIASNPSGSSTSIQTTYVNITLPLSAMFQPWSGSIYQWYPSIVIYFQDQSTGLPTGWNWSFGDGNVSMDQNPKHEWQLPGTYTVTLNVTDGYSYSENSTVIQVKESETNFTATPTTGGIPFETSFTDLSTGIPTSWLWDFGDGNSTDNTLQDPVHLYTVSGVYNVSLSIVNVNGSSTLMRENYVTAIDYPKANFTASPVSGRVPLKVAFHDTSYGIPTSWDWNFGDGIIDSNLQNPVYIYTSKGVYSVTLTATNSLGSNTTVISKYIIALPSTTITNDYSLIYPVMLLVESLPTIIGIGMLLYYVRMPKKEPIILYAGLIVFLTGVILIISMLTVIPMIGGVLGQ